MGRPLGFAAALIAGFVMFYVWSSTPKPIAADAPASDFSAAGAMTDIRAMGSVPHALGSPADNQVRDYLVRRMQSLGLSPQVQHGWAFESRPAFISGGAVDNVIGILPGRDRAAPALAFMAHHDSVHGSPGAADDTAGVASALEMIRAIKTKGVPARDVMLVITDGEEAGLLGARAFFEQSPLADHVGYVINMDTRGGGGRTQMFETAPDNGADIALYRRTAMLPQSNALAIFVYKHLPNDTDFTVAMAHGKVGLNYAFIPPVRPPMSWMWARCSIWACRSCRRPRPWPSVRCRSGRPTRSMAICLGASRRSIRRGAAGWWCWRRPH